MTTNINFRVDSEVKEQAEAIFKKAGLNTSAALNLFFALDFSPLDLIPGKYL